MWTGDTLLSVRYWTECDGNMATVMRRPDRRFVRGSWNPNGPPEFGPVLPVANAKEQPDLIWLGVSQRGVHDPDHVRRVGQLPECSSSRPLTPTQLA